MGAGIMLNAQAVSPGKAGVGKMSPFCPVEHRGTLINGWWAETAQRPAPVRRGLVDCPDVAAAMISGGWSVEALRSCTHGRGTSVNPVPQSAFRPEPVEVAA